MASFLAWNIAKLAPPQEQDDDFVHFPVLQWQQFRASLTGDEIDFFDFIYKDSCWDTDWPTIYLGASVLEILLFWWPTHQLWVGGSSFFSLAFRSDHECWDPLTFASLFSMNTIKRPDHWDAGALKVCGRKQNLDWRKESVTCLWVLLAANWAAEERVYFFKLSCRAKAPGEKLPLAIKQEGCNFRISHLAYPLASPGNDFLPFVVSLSLFILDSRWHSIRVAMKIWEYFLLTYRRNLLKVCSWWALAAQMVAFWGNSRQACRCELVTLSQHSVFTQLALELSLFVPSTCFSMVANRDTETQLLLKLMTLELVTQTADCRSIWLWQ